MGAYTKVIAKNAFYADDALQPVGFSLHVADIYVPELLSVASSTAAAAPLSSPRLRSLLQPLVLALSRTQQPALLSRIRCARHHPVKSYNASAFGLTATFQGGSRSLQIAMQCGTQAKPAGTVLLDTARCIARQESVWKSRWTPGEALCIGLARYTANSARSSIVASDLGR